MSKTDADALARSVMEKVDMQRSERISSEQCRDLFKEWKALVELVPEPATQQLQEALCFGADALLDRGSPDLRIKVCHKIMVNPMLWEGSVGFLKESGCTLAKLLVPGEPDVRAAAGIILLTLIEKRTMKGLVHEDLLAWSSHLGAWLGDSEESLLRSRSWPDGTPMPLDLYTVACLISHIGNASPAAAELFRVGGFGRLLDLFCSNAVQAAQPVNGEDLGVTVLDSVRGDRAGPVRRFHGLYWRERHDARPSGESGVVGLEGPLRQRSAAAYALAFAQGTPGMDTVWWKLAWSKSWPLFSSRSPVPGERARRTMFPSPPPQWPSAG
eukprot:jgi/Botrbrau1/22460/Bobra.0091s0062.1